MSKFLDELERKKTSLERRISNWKDKLPFLCSKIVNLQEELKKTQRHIDFIKRMTK